MIDSSLYDLLGIHAKATTAEVRSAYRNIVKKHHPDVGGQAESFLAVTRAYNVLTDVALRKRYDETGKYDLEAADASQRDLITTLSRALDRVLSRSQLSIEDTDVVSQMRKLVTKSCEMIAEDLVQMDARIKALQKARSRIRGRHDASNLFLKVMDSQIAVLSEGLLEKRHLHQVQDRAVEELGHYDSIVDMIRKVQSGLED